MPRYFLEVAYHGANYSGFQVQENTADTIQSQVERAFQTLERRPVVLTGSSRTDAGVHALQNYFHFDTEEPLHPQFVYKMNAILSGDIVLKRLVPVPAEAHCRFDAVYREYRYYVYREKNPFLVDRAYFYPYRLDLERMQEAAVLVKGVDDFTSFSKRNTQVKDFRCRVMESEWLWEGSCWVYRVKANRFLRGMVRALVATMLQVGRGSLGLGEFSVVVEARDCTKASFNAPARGLFLVGVGFPENYFGMD